MCLHKVLKVEKVSKDKAVIAYKLVYRSSKGYHTSIMMDYFEKNKIYEADLPWILSDDQKSYEAGFHCFSSLNCAVIINRFVPYISIVKVKVWGKLTFGVERWFDNSCDVVSGQFLEVLDEIHTKCVYDPVEVK